MDISAHAICLPDRPRPGYLGHQCSHAPGRPILHHRLILSQTLAGKLSYVIDSSSFCAVPLFVPGGCSFVPACACRRAARRDRQGWPSRGPCPSLPCCQATPCTGASTARGSHWTGRHRIGLVAREGAPLVENRPRDAGELVGQRNGEHVVVQSLLRRLDPGFEPIALPMLWADLDQHDPSSLNEQAPQIAITTL